MNKPNAATRKTLLGIGWLAVSLIVMGWSAYSMYIVVCHFKGGRIAGITFSTCFDSAAVIGACYMLKFIQEGRSSTFPRLFVAFCVALSALINSLHASILGEPMIMGLGYAALPVIASGLFELHVSSDRHKAQARMGKRYPSPLPSFGAARWALFTFNTLDKLMDHVYSRGNAISDSDENVMPRKLLKAQEKSRRLAIETPSQGHSVPSVTPSVPSVAAPVASPEFLSSVASSVPSVPEGTEGGTPTGTPTGAGEGREGDGEGRKASSGRSPVPSVAAPVQPVVSPVPNRANSFRSLGVARNCEWCNKSFVSEKSHARFCCDSHRVSWNKAKKRSEAAS